MAVAHAGSDKENSGHHHLLIDTELPPLDQEIPSDFNHLHFGAGETEVEVDLPPGSTLNMGIAPAGVEKAFTGHHHLLIDTPLPPLDQPIPNDFNHLHFGAGQTEAQITLPLGRHTLQLLLGDADHMVHEPPVYSKPITVHVTTTGRRPPPRRKHHRSEQQ